MRKFKFKLETLLRVKLTKKKQIQMQLSEAQEQYLKQKIIIDSILNESITLNSKLEELYLKGTQVIELIYYERYIDCLTENLKEQNKKLQKIENQITLLKEGLTSISREIKVLEKLKQYYLDIHLKEIEKEQEKLIDEIVTFKYSQDEGVYG